VNLSTSTITAKRKTKGFRFRPPRHTQVLRPEHKKARRRFAKVQLSRPEDLPTICFSDESRFVLGDDKRWIWYRRGEENEAAFHKKEKFPPSLMIFAVIGVDYKSTLLFVKGTINADKYIENLEELGFIEELDRKRGVLMWIFQQDGAPCHMAQKSLDWIEENCDLLSGWPANSPDLNPIEMLWAILKRAVEKQRPKTLVDLQTTLAIVWNNIPQAVVDKLCLSFEHRLRLCREMKGESIGHLLNTCGGDDTEAMWHSFGTAAPWTPAENRLLFAWVRANGTRNWKTITKAFPLRSTHAIKLHWHSKLRPKDEFQGRHADINTLVAQKRLAWKILRKDPLTPEEEAEFAFLEEEPDDESDESDEDHPHWPNLRPGQPSRETLPPRV
jgi:hypothetical protein